MISYPDMHQEIHHLTELSTVLRQLFRDRSLCDTDTCCGLFRNYLDLLNKHIDVVEKHFYHDLLQSNDPGMKAVANNFMSGSVELKRIVKSFKKKWCTSPENVSFRIRDYDEFIKDTDELFDVILQRIQDETEHLYPIVRTLHKVA